jgi:hypothetical protein
VPRDYASKMTPEFRRLMEVDRPPGAATGAIVPDALDRMHERYVASGMAPDHTRYGWILPS